ncbi:MAG TPA: AtpZ/AtpI family protein [Syntrophales bacterium]|nr:AtpZ/AtpI family protein [Syntrophales bacterium]HOM07229.1 AtpZ/AtpI family protein [Syntrophales bacterium]HON99710.1 AtpZ/AtpI family protein [Syntrophales bacterium]HPC01237.1 AtpZ/AtpI family protein [Syntrophales bacterium]HPQ06892.1 AtpZ/AtpI family protein [Syntrophales bacterium]
MDKESKKAMTQMAYASSIGIAMVLAIFGGLYLGYWVDKHYGTTPFFTFLFLLMGVVAGFRNLYVLIKKYFKDEKTVIRSLKTEPHRKRPAPAKA